MRKFLRILFRLTLIALITVLLTLLFGDRIFQRTSPAVRLVYDIHSPGGTPVPPSDMAAALRHRLDRQDMGQVIIRPVPTTQRVEIFSPASVPKLDLTRVLRMGGVLSFHVVVEDANEPGVADMIARTRGDTPATQPQPRDQFRWLPYPASSVAPIEVTARGVHYILVYATPDKSMTHEDPTRPWSVIRANPTQAVADGRRTGGAAVAFELDPRGGKLFADLTTNNTGRLLAIVLDGQVLSTPRINDPIGSRGVIYGGPGGFTQQEAQYLTTTLTAGSLPAQLSDEPVSEEYLSLTLGLAPMTRLLLHYAALSLAAFAIILLLARIIHRRLRPTAAEEMSRLMSGDAT